MITQIFPAKIGFDIDGVVADTSEAFLRIAKETFGYNNINHTDITEFDVTKCLSIPTKVVEEVFDFLMREPINADMRAMPHSVQVLSKMAENGPITFITARPFQEPIEEWLAHILPPAAFKKARIIAMGDHDGKVSYIKEFKLEYFIDDRTETCLDIQKAGITPIVFDQPWNTGRHDMQRVESWHCIEKRVAI